MWLITPALASLEREKRWQVWIGPNGIPYAPALAKTGIDLSRTLIIHPPTRKDLLWTISVARLILGSSVNIQVPPNLSARNYQIYIDAGINDWGGISPLTIDYVNPEAPWPALSELRQKTESKGFSLRPRLPIYPEFIFNDKNFIGEEMMSKLIAMADSEGYVKEGIKRYA